VLVFGERICISRVFISSSLGKTLALEHGLKDLLGNGYEGGEKSWQILRANGAMFELESYPLGVLGQSKSRK